MTVRHTTPYTCHFAETLLCAAHWITEEHEDTHRTQHLPKFLNDHQDNGSRSNITIDNLTTTLSGRRISILNWSKSEESIICNQNTSKYYSLAFTINLSIFSRKLILRKFSQNSVLLAWRQNSFLCEITSFFKGCFQSFYYVLLTWH